MPLSSWDGAIRLPGYGTTEAKLIATRQVLLLLLSTEITLSHRPKDTDVVKKATDAALKRYKDMSGRESKVSYDRSLSDESAGGITGSTMAGRIKVDDTLEERLKILQEKVSDTSPCPAIIVG